MTAQGWHVRLTDAQYAMRTLGLCRCTVPTLFRKSGWKYRYCGAALTLDGEWHIEHALRRALGGMDEVGNFSPTACPAIFRNEIAWLWSLRQQLGQINQRIKRISSGFVI